MSIKQFIIISFFMLLGKFSFAGHLMGGEITWQALGGDDYQFTLVIYRDCNGLDIIDPTQTIRVWRHPSVDNITCDFVSSADMSPECTQVVGGPSEIDCGVGSGGGTGPGAIQKYVYQSGAITLAGVPPADGWAFTYDSFSRNFDIINIDEPYAYGFTLSSIMYAVPGTCLDSSPQFAQDPYMLLCEGTDFRFDSNAFDEDNDSLVFSWGVPLDYFPAGDFNPPTNPAPVPFAAGFSNTNPTPDASFDPGNIAASMDDQTGEITFKSNTPGNFGFAQKIDCYRDGVLIATINRESQLIIIPCVGYDNTPPTITPPFDAGTSFDATFFAGDVINFDIEVTDVEFLQDGTPQTVTLIPSGNAFGAGLTNPAAGCDYFPCATLDESPVIDGVQGVTVNFNWETSCDHLLDACGVQQQEQVYTFVLNAKDNYCSVPGRTYETVRITLKNRFLAEPAQLTCVDVLDNGDVALSWTPAVDPDGAFDGYEVWSLEDGLITAIPAVATANYTVVGADADLDSKNYFIRTIHGCGSGLKSDSDTLETMFLEMTDLLDGRVALEWNDTHEPIHEGEATTQQIYREYPVGVWTLRGEVPYGTGVFVDTIDICEAFQSYEIRVDHNTGCTSTSNKVGALLKDKINPLIPEIEQVSVNPISGYVDVEWNVNPSEDTYGYIIYVLSDAGFWEEVDTVWDRFTPFYTYVPTSSDEAPEGYRVSAFDSCLVESVPPSYQTSALGDPHFTVHTVAVFDHCERIMNIAWTPYEGWTEEVLNYEVFSSIEGAPYESLGIITSANLTFQHKDIPYDVEICYYIKATSTEGRISISNKVCAISERPSQAAFHYITTGTHLLSEEIEVKCYTDETAAYDYYEILRKEPYTADFEVVGTVEELTGSFFTFIDEEVFPDRGTYQYRVNLIDTCGNVGAVSNTITTSFLEVRTDHVRQEHTLSWSSYDGFDGDIIEYRIYRGENGVYDATPIATTLPGVRSFVDDVSAFYTSQGQFCYRVEAVESVNSYGFAETAFSNNACATVDPLVYIPNAFMINGINTIFLPVVSLYDFDSYQLVIYDRWGGQVFETNDRNEGWDGVNQELGGYHQDGVYVYHLIFQDRSGNDFSYQGTVTLLHAE